MNNRVWGMVALLSALGLAGCGDGNAPEASAEKIAQLHEKSAAFQDREAQALASDAAAVALGHELFNAHCASCHGTDAHESKLNVPNLASAVFNYGDSVEAIRETVAHGRHSVMPALGSKMGEVDIGALVSYVQSMSNGEPPDPFRDVALHLYDLHCIACHGPEGRGNTELGVANLTDKYWLRGGSMMNIRQTITRGAESSCPSRADKLGSAEVELLTAYVTSLRTK